MLGVQSRLLSPLVHLDDCSGIVVVTNRTFRVPGAVQREQLLVVRQVREHAHGQVLRLALGHEAHVATDLHGDVDTADLARSVLRRQAESALTGCSAYWPAKSCQQE